MLHIVTSHTEPTEAESKPLWYMVVAEVAQHNLNVVF